MKITAKELAYIGKWYEGLSPISLLNPLASGEDGSELFSLMEKEIIQEDEIAKIYRPLFEIMANGRQSTKLSVKDRFGDLDVYTCRSENGLVMVTYDEEGMEVSLENTFHSVIEGLKEMVGSSSSKGINIDAVFSHGELLVLFTFLDLYRELGLKSYLGDEIEIRGLTAYEAFNELKKDTGNPLTGLLSKHLQIPAPEMWTFSDLLEQLIKKGCLVQGEDLADENQSSTYELTEGYAKLASGFLIPETLIAVEQLGINDSGQLTRAYSLCIGAGHRDLLIIALGEEDAELATLSGAELLLLIENLLSCPRL